MTIKKDIVHLNIFLVKEQYDRSDKIIHQDRCQEPLEISIAGAGKGKLYIKPSFGNTPKWFELFTNEIDIKKIGKTSSVCAAFLIKVDRRYFILVFGQGGRFLIKDDVCEERFGLIVALNSVEKESFRCIDKQSLDSIQSHTRIQSIEETTADKFGLDVEQDMLRAIVGTPEDEFLGNRMTGTDSLSVSVRMDLADLPNLLKLYKDKFEIDLSATDYRWINNISEVKKTSSIIAELDAKLISKFSTTDHTDLWLSIPEIIEWNAVKGFIYTYGDKIQHPDINLSGFLSTVDDNKSITIDTLNTRRVYCTDADHNPVYKSWRIYNCIYAELDHKGHKYILNGGTWFNVGKDFVARTNAEFNKITVSSLELPTYMGGKEGEYNESVARDHPDKFALMDDKNRIFHGGGNGQVEFCDLFSAKKEIIHVKKYGQSSVFSHLFSQGYVSGQLMQIDAEFRKKVMEKLKAPFQDLIKVDKRPDDKEFTIIFSIISDSDGIDIHLPFFSRVNLNNATKTLKGFGYKVELLKIEVDQTYAKTKICPPSKRKNLK